MIEILLPTLLLVAALTAVHAPFGKEIIERGILFTDLAIGQSAAIGVAVSIVFFENAYTYAWTLFFALGAAFIIARLSCKPYKEASIGMLYALSFALIFLLMSHSADAAETFLSLTAADILFTPLETVLLHALLYLVIVTIYFTILQKFTGKKKELLFFALFAVTVTSSIQIAGVLVVFTLLIAPAFIAKVVKKGLLFAFFTGTVAGSGSIFLSYWADLPTGYTLIFIESFLAILVISLQKRA